MNERRPAKYPTFDACCWLAPRIRTEPPRRRMEVNGAAFRYSGGQSGRLKARWSRIMQRCFHYLQRSMRRRLGSSLVPCPGAWVGCWQRWDLVSPLPNPSPSTLRAERPRVSSQAGVVSRISESGGTFLCCTLLRKPPSLVARRHLLQPSVRLLCQSFFCTFSNKPMDVWLCMLQYLLSN